MSRCKLLWAFGLAALAAVPASGQEAPWPSRPIRMIVAFPPGGTSDVMARMVSEELAKALKQPVIVENRGGAGGTTGTSAAVKLPADGYTLIQTGVGQNAVAHGLDPKLSYDSMRDFVHLTQVHSGPNVLVVNAEQPWRSFKELIAYGQANPGKLTYGYTHAASGHMAMELLKQTVSACPSGKKDCKPLFMVGIPYRGGGPMLSDLLGNQIPLMFINQDVALQHVKSGKLRALAVSSEQRNPLYPDVPTIAESGYPGFSALSWSGMSVVKGTPQPIVDRLEAELVKIMQSPAIKARMEAQGFVVPAQGSRPYTEFVRSEVERWTRVIKTAGIKPE
ncbi:tripartite tricarboxylate transporter substrate binding protein [Piscinibacter sp. XHJ-5]|uniref:Bug family tripartite tricarboxylate transporter substrate binding protein n=1 Tax=Piscinibacter sp. XHJ-5 TaxID=3037797 RepID=UPI002452C05B|nr:tripartite tricarboxylate transporter substrate binding protein [Piscinibacter sp. XHJ-5]